MYKILTILSLLVSSLMRGQLTLTINGLRDTTKIENSYLVLECPNKAAGELYKNSINYINRVYKNPTKVIHGQIENEYLKFESYVDKISEFHYFVMNYDVRCHYTIELNFKDGKFKYEIISLEMEVMAPSNKGAPGKFLVVSNGLNSFSVYKDNGKLLRPEVKADIERYFNTEIKNITQFLLSPKKDTW